MTPALELVAYNAWAAHRLIDTLETAEAVPERTRALLGHIIASEHVWHRRVQGVIAEIPFWPDLSLAELRALAQMNQSDWERVIAEDDLDRVVSYRNSQGIAYETPIHQILTHLVAHGSYHRGQVTESMRDAGMPLVNTDFIVFTRQRS
jgi:uncharacterized damage-inducible protein DinB